MAKGRKTGGRDFQKGHPGNPLGRCDPPDLRESRKLTRQEFERLVDRYLKMGSEELSKLVKDKTTSNLELMIASIVHKAIVQGDQKRLDFLLDRLIGKVVQPIQDDTTKRSLHFLTDEQLKALINNKKDPDEQPGE